MWLDKLILFCSVIKFMNAGEVGDHCTVNKENGSCVLIINCAAAISAIRDTGNHRLPRCGFDNVTEIVCCPLAPSTAGSNDVQINSRYSVKKPRPADQGCKNIIDTYSPPLGTYIIGGETSDQGEFPHAVALGYLISGAYVFNCGGSLITTQHVLTAAHCVQTIQRIQPTMVRVGVVNITGSEWNDDTDYEVDMFYVHPGYKRARKYHDLSLLRLTISIRTSNYAFPACLYTAEAEPTGPLSICGWGITNVTRAATSNVLLKARLKIVSRDICNPVYSKIRRLPDGILDGQICAGDPKGAQDTCQGDSGGPLQGLTGIDGHYRIVGITSFGRGCGSAVPGVYTRIFKYLDWIESLVWPSDQTR